MENSQKTMLRYITDTHETLKRIKELEERIASKTFRITPAYECVGGGGSGSPQVSKIEQYVEEKIMLEEELAKCRTRLTLIEYIRESGILTTLEYELIEWLQIGGHLSEFAKAHKIYKSYVYKIRDNALVKMLDFVQDTPKCNELWVKC